MRNRLFMSFVDCLSRPRRAALSVAASAWALLGSTGCAPETDQTTDAEAFPKKAITLICPWSEGGGTDRLSRFMAASLSDELGVPVNVVNRTGGGGAVGHRAGAVADPDGYTLLMGTFELSTMRSMGLSDLTHADFIPLMQLNGDAAAIIVNAESPLSSIEDLVAKAKAEPGALKMSGTASGGAWDLARVGFQLASALPVESIVWIPTQGSAPALVDLMGGHIDAVCVSLPEAAPQIEAGSLRPLAVMSEERLPEYPDCPTVKEFGIEWTAVGWRGLFLPLETPETVVSKIASALDQIVNSEAFAEFMSKNGFNQTIRKGEEFREFLAAQDEQWKGVITAGGFAP